MDIKYFIKELILLNECVILRGIGGFETKYRNAVLDTRKKLIIPPGKKIQFRPDLLKDNGVLENHIANSLGIDREEASESIDAFVQEFHDTIRQEGKVFLEGIGEFTLGNGNTLVFHEISDENYLADSFGLDILDIELEATVDEPKKKQEVQPLTPSGRKLTGWYIAIGVLLLFIAVTSLILVSSSSGFAIFKKPWGKGSAREQEMIVFGQPSSVIEDSTIQAIGQSIDENTLPKKALSIETLPVDEPVTGKTYYLIAGSFKQQKNAERLREILFRKGFNPAVKPMGSYVRVVIGTFCDRKQAIAELQRIRNQLDQSVWLLEEENKQTN